MPSALPARAGSHSQTMHAWLEGGQREVQRDRVGIRAGTDIIPVQDVLAQLSVPAPGGEVGSR